MKYSSCFTVCISWLICLVFQSFSSIFSLFLCLLFLIWWFQSGLDVRPPNGFWGHWMSELLPTIERVVRFLKHVPGFRELTINDQILLIKKGAFSIVLSQAMPMVDPDRLTILDPQLRYRNSRYVSNTNATW